MYRLRPDAQAALRVRVDGREVEVPEGASAAAAVLIAGAEAIRSTPVSGAPRLPYCMMGVCFDCLAEIDGVPNRQTCMVEAREGMSIRPQHGARVIGANEA